MGVPLANLVWHDALLLASAGRLAGEDGRKVNEDPILGVEYLAVLGASVLALREAGNVLPGSAVARPGAAGEQPVAPPLFQPLRSDQGSGPEAAGTLLG